MKTKTRDQSGSGKKISDWKSIRGVGDCTNVSREGGDIAGGAYVSRLLGFFLGGGKISWRTLERGKRS